jgi:hypothetical protein
VLRPATTKSSARAGTPGSEEPEQKIAEPMVDEAADANAIEVMVGLWCLMPLSTIFQLYHGGRGNDYKIWKRSGKL